MPGMDSGLSANDPVIVAAFRSALLHQALIAVVVIALLWLLWGTASVWLFARTEPATAKPAEPAGRAVLRIGFGLLWVLDGILQAQPKMAVGLPSQVIAQAAAGCCAW
jgi:hypothetical protein